MQPDKIGYISSNSWDIAGATMAGFRTVWVKRGNADYPYRDASPEATVNDLPAAARWFDEHRGP